MARIYLAGPEVFLPNCAQVQAAKKAICKDHGLIGVAPGDADVPDFPSAHEKGLAISARDETLMDGADAIIANLTPFRGVGADPGTSYELGYMSAQGKPAFAYTNVVQDHHDRIHDYYSGEVSLDAHGVPRGADGLLVEDFDMVDNLMLQGGIERRGGQVFVGASDDDAKFTDLAAFRRAVMAAKSLLL